MIADEVSVRHVGEFLAVLTGELQRRSDLVRDEIIHETRAGGTRIAQPHDLYRRWSQSEDFVPGAFRVTVHVHQNMDAVGVDAIGGFAIARDLRQIDEVLGLARDLRAESRAVVRTERVAKDLDFFAIV